MALHTPTFGEERRMRTLLGGPREPRATITRYEKADHPVLGGHGSHMPLDTDIHWDWRNPLNILPASLLLVTLVGLIGMLLGI